MDAPPRVGGQDLYPRLRQLLDADPDGLGRRVRMEIFKRLGYFPSESSEHNVDLVPWFLPHEGMVDRFRVTVDEYVRRSERNLGTYDEVKRKLGAGEPLGIERGPEYAPQIIHSIETGTLRTIYGNVRNTGLIENLPEGCCVEVPCLVDRSGVHPVWIGALPPQLAAVNRNYAERVRAHRPRRARGEPRPRVPRGDGRPEHRRNAHARADPGRV